MGDDRPESGQGVRVTICMGSSCFARGNLRNLELAQAFIAQHGLAGRVHLAGALCEGHCNAGPNVKVEQTLYGNVDNVAMLELMEGALSPAAPKEAGE